MAMEKTFQTGTREPLIYKKWEEAGAFKAGANAKAGAETFTIMLPPPNVTGFLHVGHAFNHTLMDILIRWKRMQGFDTLWQPGRTTQASPRRWWSNACWPTQATAARELGREAFSKRSGNGKANRRHDHRTAEAPWRLLRLVAHAFTMSGAPARPTGEEGNFHDAVIKVFRGDVQQGPDLSRQAAGQLGPAFRNRDFRSRGREHRSRRPHVALQIPAGGGATYEYVEKDEDGNVTLRETRDYISIATTRPETMLGDGAVAVHPSDERYAPIVGKLCEIPVGPKEHRRLIPIITDEYPDPDFGSGAVKITGAHDFNDYQVAKRGGIPMYRLMDTKGADARDGALCRGSRHGAGDCQRRADFDEAEIDAMNLVPDD